MKKLLTDAQRESFQQRLPSRVVKYKTALDNFHVEYKYGNLDFGLLLTKPDRSPIVEAFAEARDNSGDKFPLLIFSRPGNPIYVASNVLYWVDFVPAVIYIDSSMLESKMVIMSLDQFMEGYPDWQCVRTQAD